MSKEMATTDEELSMGETSIAATVVRAPDSEPTVDATSFDLAAWIDGVQPVHRGTTIYARADLAADLDILTEQIRNAKAGRQHDEVKRLQDQAAPIIKTMEASALDIVVTGWSNERIRAFREPLEAQGLSETDVTLEQVAAQVTSPEGFTAAMLSHLLQVSEPQANKIVGIVAQANQAAPEVVVPS